MAGRLLGILGWALLFFTVFKYFDGPLVRRELLLLALVGGVCIALGVWFSSFAIQWPIVSRYVDQEAVNARAEELRA